MPENNGNFRRTTLTFDKKINGILQTSDGWPKVYDILGAFTGYNVITAENFALLSDVDYQARLDAFYAHILNLNENTFEIASVLNSPTGTSALLCPLPEPEDPGPGSDPSIEAYLSGSFEIENLYNVAVTLTFEIEGRVNPEVWANQIVIDPAQTLLISPNQSNIIAGEKWRITATLGGIVIRFSNSLAFAVTNASYVLPVDDFIEITPDTYTNTECVVSGKLSINESSIQ